MQAAELAGEGKTEYKSIWDYTCKFSIQIKLQWGKRHVKYNLLHILFYF